MNDNQTITKRFQWFLCSAVTCLTTLMGIAEATNEVKFEKTNEITISVPVAVELIPPTVVTNAPDAHDFRTYSIVTTRNIFAPNRAMHTPRAVAQAPRVEMISLVGIINSEKGKRAFFDGSSASFRSAVKELDTVAGLTLISISSAEVNLTNSVQKLVLKIGSQLRREEEGEWEVTTAGLPTASVASSGASQNSDKTPVVESADGESDVLKRLLQKREQEESNNEKR